MSSSRSNSRSSRNGSVVSNYSSFSQSPAVSSSYSGRNNFASSTSSFSSTSFFNTRSTSPTRVHFAGLSSSPSASVRFAIDSRPTSPGRSIAFVPAKKPSAPQRKTCMCSPTTHPGSFRCSLHKGFSNPNSQQNNRISNSTRLNARRSAMVNSLVMIGTVEGDLVKRSLAALIRPSSHQQRRRASFQPRPSRLSVMSKAE